MYVCICKKSYISKLLGEFSPNKNNNSISTYSRRNLLKEELVETNIKFCKIFDSSRNVPATKNA